MQQIISIKKGWNLISFYLHNIDINILKNNKDIIQMKSLNKSYNSNVQSNFTNLNSININDRKSADTKASSS